MCVIFDYIRKVFLVFVTQATIRKIKEIGMLQNTTACFFDKSIAKADAVVITSWLFFMTCYSRTYYFLVNYYSFCFYLYFTNLVMDTSWNQFFLSFFSECQWFNLQNLNSGLTLSPFVSKNRCFQSHILKNFFFCKNVHLYYFSGIYNGVVVKVSIYESLVWGFSPICCDFF